MHPDLGLTYQQQNPNGGESIDFLQIRFSDIDFVSTDLCTTLFELPWGEQGEPHALSLDFDQSLLLELLSRLSPEAQQQFLDEVNGQLPPFHVSLPEPVLVDRVSCVLGELQEVEGEVFIPFVIRDIS
ncbi:MAG: hypothetical protein CVV07_00920 [Gammaproteobacteria bacterium HGW-Gammaproteobacteria-11]|nr:MAG: hypothetical protein CVV07_00920 [Gammaproteobacteria bacterium HGW-Gammaproteobacteria-11]